jgi:hypothetical protein
MFIAPAFAVQLGAARDWSANTSEAYAVNVTKDGSGLCNSVAFSQVPDHRDLFLGRLKENTGPDACSGNNWAIALFEMDWNKKELRFIRYVLKPPFSIPGDGRVINSAYDPYAIQFKGKLWVAFECAASDSVSSCIGPVDLEKGMDASCVSVPASGGPKTNSEAWQVAASDPKLLLFKRRLYLYWTLIRSDEHGWIDGAVRGAQLVEDEHPQKRLWLKEAIGRPVRANDSKVTVEIWGPIASDPLSNSFVDVFGIYTDGNSIIASAGLGGRGTALSEQCLTPGGTSLGCFRLAISKASEPLGRDAFNTGEVHAVGFPGNPQEYSRLVEDPKGALFMMGMYFNPPAKYAAQYQARTLPRGLLLYPISVR